MKLCFVLVIFLISYCLVNVNSQSTFEKWHPKYLAEVLANKTKDFTGRVHTQIGEASKKRQEIQRSITDFLGNTRESVYKTISTYIEKADKARSNAIETVSKSVATNVLNTNEITKYNPDMYLDTVQLISKNGYPAEAHTVLTDDGYLLTMHRIPHARGAPVSSFGRQAVLLQHGLLASSSNFVTSGAEKGLAYILSEAGYDVWMGNFRGNTYSRSHISLSTKDAAFWNFTWHECAMHDLPAMIDYINEIKGTNDLLYIGHSMGTTALFALLSTRLEYNNKMKAAFTMAPVAFMTGVRSPIKMLAPYANNIEWIAKYLGADEFVPQGVIFKWLASVGCKVNRYSEEICRNLLFLIAGYDPKEFNNENFPVILSHTPAGTSTKTVLHFAQEIRDKGKFQQFDYGEEKNRIAYNQTTPPEYEVRKITLPIAVICSSNDLLNSLNDSMLLYVQLANPIEYYKVPMEEFNHLDFLWGINAPTLVYDKILTLMKKYEIKENLFWPISFKLQYS